MSRAVDCTAASDVMNACALASRFLAAVAISVTVVATGGYAIAYLPGIYKYEVLRLSMGAFAGKAIPAFVASTKVLTATGAMVSGAVQAAGVSAAITGIGAAITAGVNSGEEHVYTVDNLEELLGKNFVSTEDLVEMYGWTA